jgi:2'-5' RNA ligase
MRTFIAIELPLEIKNRLTQLQKELRETGADVKWVEPRNIHLTLRFLGDISKEQLNRIETALDKLAINNHAFNATLSTLGVFPKIEFARVIWVGINEGEKEAIAVAKDLEDRLQGLGLPKEERPFSTHITLGRVRSPKNKEKLISALQELGEKLAKENLEFHVGKIALFKSSLTSSGPIYETLKEVHLINT